LPITALELSEMLTFFGGEPLKDRTAAHVFRGTGRPAVELKPAAFGRDRDPQRVARKDAFGRGSVDGPARCPPDAGSTLVARAENLHDRLGGHEPARRRDFLDQRLDIRAQKLGRAVTGVAD